MKKLGLTTIVLAALLLTGCGGGGKNSSNTNQPQTIKEQIKSRDIIVIFHNYPDDVCTSQRLKDTLNNNTTTNIITNIVNNNVTCKSYGRNSETCTENSFSQGTNACVVGADLKNSNIKTFNNNIADTMLQSL